MALKLTRRGRAVISLAALVGMMALLAVLLWATTNHLNAPAEPSASQQSQSATPTPTPTESTTPLSPAEQHQADAARLRDSGENPNACAVTYTADGIDPQYAIETAGTRFKHAPIPRREGLAFAGWYTSSDAAASADQTQRRNGAHLVECPDGVLTLHGSFQDRQATIDEGVAVPILMYHQFTENPEGEDHWLRANYAYIGDFDAHLAYIKTQGFYLPTWDELSAFIDGDLSLPHRSVIVTDDDAHETWYRLGVPAVDKNQVLTTSFVITSDRPEHPSPSEWVLQRSHTHALHWGGDDGQGVITSKPHDEVVADLRQSADLLGASEVIAYPFGHYNDSAQAALVEAGFTMGRSVEDGYVRVGTDKLALPVIRINYGMGVDALANLIG